MTLTECFGPSSLRVLLLSALGRCRERGVFAVRKGPGAGARLELPHRVTAVSLIAIGLACCSPAAKIVQGALADDAAFSNAVCPIGYQLDEFPSSRGYRYLFYGNGFFINKEGHLITAAHVLSQLHGVKPYVLLRTPAAPPRLVQAVPVIVDAEHDVAVLQATPNPFAGHYRVKFLSLGTSRLPRAQTVLAAALRPSHPNDPQTYDSFLEDRPSGQVLTYQFSQLQKGGADTELFLFSHEVIPGESGAPVVVAGSQAAVGIVDGRWLRSDAIPLVSASQQPFGVGAVVPIHYAIALLQRKGISWSRVPESSESREAPVAQPDHLSLPEPLSLVAAPYPSQALLGGEVVLDALVNRNGVLADIKVVHGENPFLPKALDAAQTWSFLPARSNAQVAEQRIGIVFQFPQSILPPAKPERRYQEPLPSAAVRGALPVATLEPDYQAVTEEGSVILWAVFDAYGKLTSTQVLRGVESLTPAALAAVRQWSFAPGKQAGANVESGAVVVFTFRRAARPSPSASALSSK
jgi:hypothetical protein